MIKAENFEGFKEDNEVMKRWPLRAWTDSAYRLFLMKSTHYSQFYIQFVYRATHHFTHAFKNLGFRLFLIKKV
jgi:hypothetical protein